MRVLPSLCFLIVGRSFGRRPTQRVVVVVTGEFGRTPKVNYQPSTGVGNASAPAGTKQPGRDHWAPLTTVAMAGGGLQMGQVVGESADKVDVPKTKPIRPQDLMATVFQVLGMNPRMQFVNTAGRPVYMVEDGKPIEELA